MQSYSADISVLNRGIKETHSFGIVDSPEMYDLLSSKLYPDKIKAVIRELSTNAVDSHKSANTKRKFIVHLPTLGKPNFFIRDFGTGLTKEQLITLYNSYGKSDKNHSNDFIGGMGIGSKSPFAYTNSFIVTSYCNGMKYICICAKNEDGKPELNMAVEEKTSEPNGLEVSFSVAGSDIESFKEKADLVYRYFGEDERPEIQGSPLVIEEVKCLYSGNGWKKHGNEVSHAVVGNIAYPIDFSFFSKYPSEDTRRYKVDEYLEYRILKMGIDIDFPIGPPEIGGILFDASRENLQYTQSVIKIIKSRLNSILQELRDKINNDIANTKSLWQASVIANEFAHKNFEPFYKDILRGMNWDGKTLLAGNVNFTLEKSTLLYEAGLKNPKYARYQSGYPLKSALFFVEDIKRGGYTLVSNYVKSTGKSAYLIKFQDDAQRSKFMETLGLCEEDLQLASSLPKPQKKPVVKKGVSYKCFLFKTKNTFINGSLSWVSEDYKKRQWEEKCLLTVEDGGYYVSLTKHFNTQNIFSPDTLSNIRLYFKDLTGFDKPIYGIKERDLHKFTKCDKWIELLGYIKNTVISLLTPDVVDNIQKCNEFSESIYDRFKVLLYDNVSDGVFKEFSKKLIELKSYKMDDKTKKIYYLANHFSLITHKTINDSIIYAEYPLLNIINSYEISSKNKKIILDYIYLIDRRNDECLRSMQR